MRMRTWHTVGRGYKYIHINLLEQIKSYFLIFMDHILTSLCYVLT